MKKFIVFAIVVMILVSVECAEAQWPFPQPVDSRRTQVSQQEALRPVLKQRDGTPVVYAEVEAPATFTIPTGTRVLVSLLESTAYDVGRNRFRDLRRSAATSRDR